MPREFTTSPRSGVAVAGWSFVVLFLFLLAVVAGNWGAVALFGALAALIVVLVVRGLGAKVMVDHQWVTVINPPRRHRVPRSEIVSVALEQKGFNPDPRVFLHLRDGQRIRVAGISVGSGPGTRFFDAGTRCLDELRELLGMDPLFGDHQTSEDQGIRMEQGRTREEMRAKLEQRRRGEISPTELVKWHGEPRDAAVKEARETFMTEMVALLELFDRGEITGEELYGPFKELQTGGPTQGDELFEITEEVFWALDIFPEEIPLDELKEVVERNLIKLKVLVRDNQPKPDVPG